MRDELQLMELVDRYLEGSMNAEERRAFEARVNSNEELRQLLDDMHALREGTQRAVLRPAVQLAYRDFRPGKGKPWFGSASIVIIVAAGYHFWPQLMHLLPQERIEVTVPDTIPAEAPAEQGDQRTITYTTRDTVVDTVYRIRKNGKWRVLDHRPTAGELFEDSIISGSASEPLPLFPDDRAAPAEQSAELKGRETQPQFPGGMDALHAYLEKNIRHPDLSKPLEGTVDVRFVIDEHGNATKATVVRGLNAAYDAEALRVINSMPRWIPASMNGKPMTSAMELPLRFRNPGVEEAP